MHSAVPSAALWLSLALLVTGPGWLPEAAAEASVGSACVKGAAAVAGVCAGGLGGLFFRLRRLALHEKQGACQLSEPVQYHTCA